MEIRLAISADRDELDRLAGRDSTDVPSGELLVAIAGEHLCAALSLDTGAAIADPFEPTEAAVAALRAYVNASTPQSIWLHLSGRPPWRRSAFAGVSGRGSGSPRKSTVRFPFGSPSA